MPPRIFLTAGAALLLARAWHYVAALRAQRDYTARRALTPDGLVAGAEGFALAGNNGRAVLLLHGSGDSPQSLRYLAERVHEAGYTVLVPLLPGHGRAPRDFARVSASAYSDAAQDALNRLLAVGGKVTVGGLSMGGALAARLAAENDRVDALILLAPYLLVPFSIRAVAATSRLWGVALPFVAGRGERSVHDPDAARRGLAYGMFSPASLRAMVATARAGHASLSRVRVPTLVVNSADDNRIPLALAERASAPLGACAERHWVEGCGHVITADYCKDRVVELVLAFLRRTAPLVPTD